MTHRAYLCLHARLLRFTVSAKVWSSLKQILFPWPHKKGNNCNCNPAILKPTSRPTEPHIQQVNQPSRGPPVVYWVWRSVGLDGVRQSAGGGSALETTAAVVRHHTRWSGSAANILVSSSIELGAHIQRVDAHVQIWKLPSKDGWFSELPWCFTHCTIQWTYWPRTEAVLERIWLAGGCLWRKLVTVYIYFGQDSATEPDMPSNCNLFPILGQIILSTAVDYKIWLLHW